MYKTILYDLFGEFFQNDGRPSNWLAQTKLKPYLYSKVEHGFTKMKISEIAKASGLTVKAIRYYESVGLLPKASRSDNGYRHYDDALLPTLRLIGKARMAGFSVSECTDLVALLNNPERHSAEVHGVVEAKIALIDKQLKELAEIKEHLVALADTCANDAESQCTILESLSHG